MPVRGSHKTRACTRSQRSQRKIKGGADDWIRFMENYSPDMGAWDEATVAGILEAIQGNQSVLDDAINALMEVENFLKKLEDAGVPMGKQKLEELKMQIQAVFSRTSQRSRDVVRKFKRARPPSGDGAGQGVGDGAAPRRSGDGAGTSQAFFSQTQGTTAGSKKQRTNLGKPVRVGKLEAIAPDGLYRPTKAKLESMKKEDLIRVYNFAVDHELIEGGEKINEGDRNVENKTLIGIINGATYWKLEGT